MLGVIQVAPSYLVQSLPFGSTRIGKYFSAGAPDKCGTEGAVQGPFAVVRKDDHIRIPKSSRARSSRAFDSIGTDRAGCFLVQSQELLALRHDPRFRNRRARWGQGKKMVFDPVFLQELRKELPASRRSL